MPNSKLSRQGKVEAPKTQIQWTIKKKSIKERRRKIGEKKNGNTKQWKRKSNKKTEIETESEIS